MKKDRFVTIYKQGVASSTKLMVDTLTGVTYIYHSEGYSGGMTVLLDRDGKPVITPLREIE